MRSAEHKSQFRFVVMGLCFLSSLVNYIDRAVISFAIEPIKADFGLDNTTFGLIITAFALGTVSVNALAGWLLDRSNVRVVWTASIFAWSIVMILLGMVHLVALFLVLRYLLGEGVNFPAMNRAMADWMPKEELSRMVSIGLLGVPMAMLVGAPILSHLIDGIGWRWSFIYLGIAGLVVAAIWLIVHRNGPLRELGQQQSDVALARGSWPALLKDPTLLATSWSFFAFGYVLFLASVGCPDTSSKPMV